MVSCNKCTKKWNPDIAPHKTLAVSVCVVIWFKQPWSDWSSQVLCLRTHPVERWHVQG